MDRRSLIATALASLAAAPALAQDEPPSDYERQPPPDYGPPRAPAPTYNDDEVVNRVSNFLGVTAESAGAAVERAFRDNGRPTGYIAGEEGSGAFVFGLRYGRGLLYMKDRRTTEVFWQGPSVGFDAGGNASRVFTLCYNLQYPDAIFRRFPGVEGTAYFIGGIGVNYARAEDIVLAPMRVGVGLRLGANVGYLAYTRRRNVLPF
ncbi:MAG TPA: DUF1134 domain-containing protein [Caulobacteraceae bacterium]|nr:DUF1134 domain-containing protein [Caulobacteraceae bacterium]